MGETPTNHENHTYPLVLVFYLDRELMGQPQIIQPFVESVNRIIDIKKMNAVAFFLPTEGDERVECINPVIAPKEDLDKITQIIADISKEFAIGTNLEMKTELDTTSDINVG